MDKLFIFWKKYIIGGKHYEKLCTHQEDDKEATKSLLFWPETNLERIESGDKNCAEWEGVWPKEIEEHRQKEWQIIYISR